MEEKDYNAFLEQVKPLAEQLNAVFDLAFAMYSGLVQDVLADRITDEKQIEEILDGLASFQGYWRCPSRCVVTFSTATRSSSMILRTSTRPAIWRVVKMMRIRRSK